MKVAKVHSGLHKDKWLVHDAERGWVGPANETVQPEASQKHTKFFAGLTEAKIDGFSPTEIQAKVIAKWSPSTTPVETTPKK